MLPWILGNCTSSNSASDVGYDTQSGIKWDTLINWQTLEAYASDHHAAFDYFICSSSDDFLGAYFFIL